MRIPPIFNPQRKIKFLWLVLNGFMQAVMAVSFSILVKSVFDNFLYANKISLSLFSISFFFLVIIIVTAWLKYRERSDAEMLGQDYVHELRKRMFSRLCRTDLRQLDHHGRGDIILRFASDLSAIRQWVSLGYARLLVSGIIIVFALCMLSFINLTLAIMIGIVMLINTLLAIYIGQKMENTFREARRSRSSLANNLTEKITSLITVKASGQRSREKNRISQQSLRVVNSMVARAKAIGIHRAITEGSLLVSSATVLIVGTVLIRNGSTTPGSVVGAMVFVALLTQPLRNIGRVYEYWHGANIAKEKLEQFLKKVEPSRRERPDKKGKGLLVLSGLQDFSGVANTKKIIPLGKKIVILGNNGAGKSSLLAEIAGLLKPSTGHVTLDDINVLSLHEKYLRTMIGMVSSSLPLIKGTIRKNICYRWPSAPLEEVNQIIEECGLSDFVAQTALGLDHRVTTAGANLSLGQQQKIILARALLGSPKILLLDEADNFLDDESRILFSSIVKNYTGTVIMATHNIDQMMFADEVWLIANGGIKWHGKPVDFSINLLEQQLTSNTSGEILDA